MNAQNIPKFEYQKPQLQAPTGGQVLQDFLLGTNNAQNIAANNNLAQQQAFNQQAMNAANEFNKYMWDQQAQYNTDKYNQTMKYNKYMASTQYQRTVEDMKKAGINPLVAFANGASTNSVGNSALGSVGGSSSANAQSGQGSEKGMNVLNGLLGQATAQFVSKLTNKVTDKFLDKLYPEEKVMNILSKVL